MTTGSPILMPKLGLTMTEGMLAEWKVGVGDVVRSGDVLFTVETDKIATDVEARGDGTILSIAVAEGDTVDVGTVLGMWSGGSLDMDSGDVADIPPRDEHAAAAPPAAAPRVTATGGTRLRATPLARRMARSADIDLAAVAGSGPGGRIKAIDVQRASTEAASAGARPAAQAAADVVETRRSATRIEQIVARRLTQSKQTIPHFYAFADIDVTDLMAMRATLNADAAAAKLTLTHFLVAALARSLAAAPELNARWDDGEIVLRDRIDIGVAVDSPRGLVVPVVRGADRLAIDPLAHAVNVLIDKARSGGLSPADMEGATISISNVGMFGATALAPIVDPGQSAILGVGAPKEIFRPDAHGRPTLRRELMLILSCDHRIFDGVTAAKLLDRMRVLIENPVRLVRG